MQLNLQTLITCLLLLVTVPVHSQHTGTDMVAWDRHVLVWDDFQGDPPKHPPASAVAETATNILLNTVDNSRPGELEVEILAIFVKEESWVLPGKRNAAVLNHEQRHFDISEYCARRIRSELEGLDSHNRTFNRITEECESLQDQYDRETRNGINKNAQERWDKKIDRWLKETDKYAGTRVVLTY